ncbi:hypothetical protein RQM59_01030 [Flavobacteriaceae bacterium S356]|uniref:YopX protein domain-containing protein n=1 Tax=Asprobacillus argus TaxID=3076534 RepID=A0ABU3LB91_9FLAO|nr:hypothetical protein [Flavobacteriaceae bacterium S356]
MGKKWRHFTTVADGEYFLIDEINIWDHKWIDTKQKVNIRDPLYNQKYTFSIFEIQDGNKIIKFIAGEFSNCVWGIYTLDG